MKYKLIFSALLTSMQFNSPGFLTLGLPADHKFWTDASAPWTSLKVWSGQTIKKDYKVEY